MRAAAAAVEAASFPVRHAGQANGSVAAGEEDVLPTRRRQGNAPQAEEQPHFLWFIFSCPIAYRQFPFV